MAEKSAAARARRHARRLGASRAALQEHRVEECRRIRRRDDDPEITHGFGDYKGVEDFIQPYTKVAAKDVVPTIPAAAVIQPANWMDPNHWTLKSNFYDPKGKAPTEIFAVVNIGSGPSTRVPLTLATTTKKSPTARTPTIETPPNYEPFCEKVYFQARRADGTVARFPETGSIGFGSNLEAQLSNHANCYNTWQGAIPAPPGDGGSGGGNRRRS